MKQFAVLTLVLCAGLLSRADDKKKPADAPKIAGTYDLTKGMKDGKPTSDEAKKVQYVFDDKKITIGDKEGKFVISYKLDGAKIDMEMLEAPFEGLKGSKAYGIVEMKEGTLKLAYNTEKDKRPKDFDGKEGFSFELKKAKDKPKE